VSITEFFANPSLPGIGLALVFGAIWIVSLSPLNWRTPLTLAFLATSVILFPISIAWIQAPLQNIVHNLFISHIGTISYQRDILYTAIPVILLSGLVQEGAKLLPTVVYWLFKHRAVNPKLGLSIGAMVGVGFGVFEAQWVLNSIFAQGWNPQLINVYGFMGIAGFWERFFTVAFHTASAGLTGWGLARGYGWQFYLVASFIHSLSNYTIVLIQKGILNSFWIEIVIAIMAVALFAAVSWLRWRKEIIQQQGSEFE
jgi:RsiW-degrading membrane proteinase PrsW (M82 family)